MLQFKCVGSQAFLLFRTATLHPCVSVGGAGCVRVCVRVNEKEQDKIYSKGFSFLLF